ncbi:MAG: beta-galactosidase, partial [Lentisphaerae bacterium]|nr:beta-galactosidase [Lentisphaerota bacterium]
YDGQMFTPDVTSYDFGAPLNEYGEPTEKYFACREVIRRFAPVPDIALPAAVSRRAFGTVDLREHAPLLAQLDQLSRPVRSAVPLTMEALGQGYGFILYRTVVRGPRDRETLVLQEVHDRALVFVDGKFEGIISRDMKESPVTLELGPGEHQLDILVEAQARVNYGRWLHDRKGITEGVCLGGQFLFDWTIFPLPLTRLRKLRYGAVASAVGPVFHRGFFDVAEPADTFLACPGWTKGVAWINGFNLGRYWEEQGPQRTLYVPMPLLKKGRNEVIMLELHGTASSKIEFRDNPDLG